MTENRDARVESKTGGE